MFNNILISTGEAIYKLVSYEYRHKIRGEWMEQVIHDIENFYPHELDYDLEKACDKLGILKYGHFYMTWRGKKIIPKKIKVQLKQLEKQMKEQKRLERKDHNFKMKVMLEAYESANKRWKVAK